MTLDKWKKGGRGETREGRRRGRGGDGAVVGKVRDEETESGEMKIRRKSLE